MTRFHPILIQSPIYTPSASGERMQTWGTVVNSMAIIKPLSGREMERAKSFGATVSHLFDNVRYNQAIVPTCRIQYGIRYFSIDAVINQNEANHWMTIYATEIIGGA